MFKIGNKSIGDGHPAFAIAEAGVNHNGELALAKQLVDKAVWAGADAVKFQTFKAEKLVTTYAEKASYQKENTGNHDESQFDMLKKLELSYNDFIELKAYCDEKNIIFLSTPFDFESASFLKEIGVEAFKFSSGDLTNIPFLQFVARFDKPIILSSGMSTLGDIEEAVDAIYKSDNNKLAVLHCTSNYPASIESVNLKAMLTIKNAFNVVGGYSDHTEGIVISCSAVALGANIIEKHFTLDKNMEGPDHKASLQPEELKEMIDNIRKIESALGDGIKKYSNNEVDTMKVARKSIVSSRYINKGETISFDCLDYKRPGTGLLPKYYKDLLGKKAKIDISQDEQINFFMVE